MSEKPDVDNGKLELCGACGGEVAKSAITCPHCGAVRGKNSTGQVAGQAAQVFGCCAAALLIFIGCFLLVKSGLFSNFLKEDADTEPQFLVGESAESDGVKVTLNSVKETRGASYNRPSEGKVFVVCEFDIQNDSSSDLGISSFLSFSAYCDDYKCQYSLGAILSGETSQLDGQVTAGKKMRGVVGYEVPKNWQRLEIHFSPNIAKRKKLVFVATNKNSAQGKS